MKLKLHTLIFLGLIGGVALGLGLWQAGPRGGAAPAWWPTTMWTLDLFGQTMFVGALRMIIAPLIFVSIVAAVSSVQRVGEIGAIGVKTLTFYALTLGVALAIALTYVNIVRPGETASSRAERDRRSAELVERRDRYQDETALAALDEAGRPTTEYREWLARVEGAATADARMAAAGSQAQRTPAEIFKEDILLAMLRNPFASLAGNNALGIIFFALLLGIACTAIGPVGQPVVAVFRGLSEALLRMTHWVMMIAPLAVLCIMAKLVAETGPGVFQSLGWFAGVVIAAILTHIVVLVVLTWTLGRVGPLALWRGTREAILIAFSTRSSAATLPVSLACVTENLKVSPKVANFALPVGATMNMDGTAIHQCVSVIFLIQMYGGLDDVPVVLDAFTMAMIALMSGFAAIGAAPMPNAGLIIMALVASVAGLPLYYLPFVFAIDSILDMFRTVVNVLGDIAGAVIVSRLTPLADDAPARDERGF